MQQVETSVGHVQVTVKCNDDFGCRLYWRDAVGDVPCVYSIKFPVQRGFSDVPFVYCIMLPVQRGIS